MSEWHTIDDEPEGAGCPRRLWVLTTLSDDELQGSDEPLPQGLQFHLSRCASCRALAERLRGVCSELAEMSRVEPPEGLLARANLQADGALSAGATLTGRVAIPDEPPRRVPIETRPHGIRRWARPFAAAAVVALAVTLYGLSLRDAPPERGALDAEPPAGPAIARAPESTGASSPSDGRRGGRADEAATHADAQPPVLVTTRVRRFHSHFEAAFTDQPGGAQAGIVLPGPRTLELGWLSLFDTPGSVESTAPSANDIER